MDAYRPTRDCRDNMDGNATLSGFSRPSGRSTNACGCRGRVHLRLQFILGVVISALLCSHEASAQILGFRAGVSHYDLVGTGTAPVVSAYRSWAVHRRVFLAASLPVFDAQRTVHVGGFQVSDPTVLLLPELTLGLRPLVGRLQPVVGLGAGWALRLKGSQASGPTIHVTIGAGLQVAGHTALTLTALARSVRPWAGSTVDLMAGIEIGRIH